MGGLNCVLLVLDFCGDRGRSTVMARYDPSRYWTSSGEVERIRGGTIPGE